MKNELNDAWDKQVKVDNAIIKETADKFYGGETEFPSGERVKMSLPKRAKIHGCHIAAMWDYDYSVHIGEIMKHTGMSRQETLLFLVFLELKSQTK